jgi:ATP-binding protein involved in chromosome partitioning
MNVYVCPKCGHSSHIFGQGGGQKVAKEIDVPVLGDIPLDTVVREGSDSGQPVTIAQPHGEIAKTYHNIAQEIWTRLS